MADSTVGAVAPVQTLPPYTGPRTRGGPGADTRRRRCHGVFIVGNELAGVYSTRTDVSRMVHLEFGADCVKLSGRMSAGVARQVATAMLAAADAVDGGAR